MKELGIFIVVLLCGLYLGLIIGNKITRGVYKDKNHTTQELCEYSNETKCVNAWIPESMQNPKSIEVKK